MAIIDDSTFVKTRIDHFDVAHRWTMNLSQIFTEERNSCPEMKSYMMLMITHKLADICTHKLLLNTFTCNTKYF